MGVMEGDDIKKKEKNEHSLDLDRDDEGISKMNFYRYMIDIVGIHILQFIVNFKI